MNQKKLIKQAVEEHLNQQFSKSSFSPEVLAKVEQRISSRIAYYDKLFKDDHGAKEIASNFSSQKRGELGNYEKYQANSVKKQEYKVNSLFREREYIIKNFYAPGLSYEQIKDLYWQYKINNPKKI